MTADITGADAGFMGLYMELDAILAVVIGGTPMEGGKYNLKGTVVGVLIIQTLTTNNTYPWCATGIYYNSQGNSSSCGTYYSVTEGSGND